MQIKQFELKDGSTINYREGTTDLPCIKEVLMTKQYQLRKLDFVFDEGSQKDKLWLDLGGNIGTFSRLVQIAGGKTIAFEPIPENFEMLLTNVDTSRTDAFCSAVTCSKAKKIEFFTATKETDKYRFTTLKNARPIGSFNNTYIGDLMDMNFHGIKLDIEGAELEMIDKKLIPNCNFLVMEYHFSKDKDMKNFQARMENLRSMFSTVHYSPSIDKYKDFFPVHMDQMIYCVK